MSTKLAATASHPVDARAVDARARLASPALLGLPLILLSVGHFFVDLYSSALGALQPLLVEQFGINLTQAGLLGGVLVFSASVMQPLYGYLSDRWRTKLFVALGPAVAGTFISALGLAPGYGWLLAMVLLGGVGVAAFHPQAAAGATSGLASHRGRAMAVFVSAGTLGFALGPTYFSAVTEAVGLSRAFWAAAPGILVSGFLIVTLPPPPLRTSRPGGRQQWTALKGCWKPLTILYFLVFLRSIIQVTFAQFLPLYLHRERGFLLPDANHLLSAYLAAGAVGGFLGGHLADRFGGRRVIQLSMICSAPFLIAFFFASGAWAALSLLAGGLILLFTIPVNVVMAQELAPAHASTISALMMGFSWGMAGLLFIPLTGWVADLTSLHTALASLTVFPVVGYLLSLKLPR